MQVGDTAYVHFTVFDTDGVTPLTGQAGSVSDALRLNGASSAQSVTISETGATGRYYATFVPNAVGIWDLELSCSDDRVLGASFEVENNDADSLASDVSDVQSDTDDIQSRLPAALVGGRMDSDIGNVQAGAIDAAAVATDAIDADALAADAVTEIQSGLATSVAMAAVQADTDDIQTRLPAALVGGRMDSDVGAMQGDVVTAAAVATDAIDADALASDAVDEIVDRTWDEDVTGHLGGDKAGQYLSDAAAGGASLTQQEVRDAMKLAPSGGAPAAGSVDNHLDTIEGDTQAIEPLVTGNLDAAISTRSSHDASDVDAAVTASHGLGSYLTATGFATPGDAMDLVAGAVDAAAVDTDAIDADAVAADAVAEIQSGLATSAEVAAVATDLERLLGLSHENSFLDSTTFDATDQLLTARLRCFDSKTNADAATDGGSETTGLIATYQITAVYEAAGRLQEYRMTLESP